MSLEQTWRWYGPNDPISLSDIRQAGATGIVTALHHISNGEVWELDAILERKKEVEDAGLAWSVIESIPVHEDIKQGKGNRDLYIERYKESLRNVGKAGIPCVCYNFMPVVDWTRTNLYHEMQSGAKALAFFQDEFSAFDLFVLKREGAENDYTEEEKKKAEAKFKELTDADIERLTRTIIAGLPGAEETYTIEQFREALNEYKDITPEVYRENIAHFLKEVIPVAEEAGVRMAVHADDPPRSIFGLPRVVSTAEDLRRMFEMAPSIYNGVTLCAGSFGVRADNDLPAMVEEFNERIHFVHLRSVSRTEAGDFIEDEHLAGDVDMYELMLSLLKEQKRREEAGSDAPQIPMRPDHGHLLLDDPKRSNPGYTAIGRLKGLAELRGLEMGILRSGILCD